jgi:hypothetical protein
MQHLQKLSISHFHWSDFILVLHNMYERQRTVSVLYLRVIEQLGNDSFVEQIAPHWSTHIGLTYKQIFKIH